MNQNNNMYGCEDPEEVKERWREIEEREEQDSQNSGNF